MFFFFGKRQASGRTPDAGKPDGERVSTWVQAREIWYLLVPALLLLSGAFWLASRFIAPAPPKSIVMATGSTSGAYHAMGGQYARALAASGIQVVLRPTAGSVENAKLMANRDSGVDVALLQGGIADASSLPGVVSLGRMFLEPVWVFHACGPGVSSLSGLKGKRVAVGAEGSGTRALAVALLAANQAAASPTVLLPLGGEPAVAAMAAGEADAVVLVLAPSAPIIQALLRDTRFALMGFEQADAYTRIFPCLARITLPRGVVDLVADRPGHDIPMVGASAALMARSDVHPSIAGLLAKAAQDVHASGTLFYGAGEYPKATDPEFPMSEDAESVYRSGPSLLKRMLPFWLAIFVERMLVMLLPVATVLFPLIKLVPWLYQWRIKRRIFYWYAQLKRLERRMAQAGTDADVAAHAAEIERIEKAVTVIPVPVTYSENLFNLRGAVGLVRGRIAEAQRRGA